MARPYCHLPNCHGQATWTHVAGDGTETALCTAHAERLNRVNDDWPAAACERLLNAVYPARNQAAVDAEFARLVNEELA